MKPLGETLVSRTEGAEVSGFRVFVQEAVATSQ